MLTVLIVIAHLQLAEICCIRCICEHCLKPLITLINGRLLYRTDTFTACVDEV